MFGIYYVSDCFCALTFGVFLRGNLSNMFASLKRILERHYTEIVG